MGSRVIPQAKLNADADCTNGWVGSSNAFANAARGPSQADTITRWQAAGPSNWIMGKVAGGWAKQFDFGKSDRRSGQTVGLLVKMPGVGPSN